MEAYFENVFTNSGNNSGSKFSNYNSTTTNKTNKELISLLINSYVKQKKTHKLKEFIEKNKYIL